MPEVDVTPPQIPQKSARLQVRINQIDYVLAPPGDLDNSSLPRVPVLRIFGSSSTGQAACVHVHQVYPYFLVEYSGKLSPRHVNHYIAKLFRSLNHAIAISLKRNPRSPKSQFIRAIVLVKGVHFYGFHASYTPFLKILVADPTYVTRMVTILQSASVMSTRFRVFESHLSYTLQFLCDFDLYGCGVIQLEDALERSTEGPEEQIQLSPSTDSNGVKFGVSSYFRESRLPLEVDVIAPHILNRHRLVARQLHHRLEIPAPVLPPEPLILSVRELWEDERSRRRALGLNPSPEIPVDPSESSRAASGEWVAEARWWDEIRKRIESERSLPAPNFDEKQRDWERFVMTIFESIEALWEKEYKTWKPPERLGGPQEPDRKMEPLPPEYTWDVKSDPDADTKDDQIEVDISMLSNQEINQLDQEEAQGWNRDAFPDQLGGEENAEEEEEDTTPEEDIQPGSPNIVPEGKEEHATIPVDPFLEGTGDARTKSQEYRLVRPPTPSRLGPQVREGSPTPTNCSCALFLYISNDEFTDIDMEEARPHSEIDPNVTPTKSNKTPSKSTNAVLGFGSTFEDDLLPLRDGSQQDGTTRDPPIQMTERLPATTPTLTAKERSSLITARAVKLSRAFDICKATNSNRYVYSLQPPSSTELKADLKTLGLASKIYQAPYYSKDVDVPEMPKEYAGLIYRLKGGQGIATLEEWTATECSQVPLNAQTSLLELNASGVGGWEYASHPPSVKEVRQSLHLLDTESFGRKSNTKFKSQIEGPTQANIYGFKTSPTIAEGSTSRERANMSVLSLELFVPTHDMKAPNSESDEVVAIFYAHHVSGSDSFHAGVLVLENPQLDQKRLRHVKFEVLKTELDLLNRLVDLVIEIDPDILIGWEVQNNSWGYLEARGAALGLTISELISRAPARSSGGSNDQWSLRKASTFKVAGRHVLNLWRIMRSEKTLTIYTFENVVFDVLRQRVPRYSYKTLTEWYRSEVPMHASYLFRHLSMRVIANLQLLEETETITKTAEFARVFGVDFFSVISRGSQFKVESFLFRLAKPESFVLISPSKNDVGKQNAAECMPLIMEPASAFYSSPLLVLDFQSLYPSIMIAYNYCYSTCLGRVTDFQGKNKFGVVDDLDIPSALIINPVAPNGIMYVKSNVRKGLLGRMLVELLETRVMVKQAMKRVGGDKARKKILDARQLSLKYIANVTYGYTSASFSGRMPAVEIADSIVQSGRETLEKAIDVIESTKKWGAKVVYGDTDSVFVYLPGRTKEEAFALGNEIANTITAMNPAPVKLKFEKVYLPCVLLAKKRYVGFKYESIDDVEPVFDAKGIETVRRDGVLAQRKMVENSLKILFRTQDLSEVKDYCCRSWTKLFENKASVQDFIFAKEVRMGTYSDKGPPPPGVVVAARRMALDPNDEPQYGDRIPYVVVRSTSGARLVDRAMDPLEFMNNSQLRLDAIYYITRVLIPPLERIFNLVGADVKQWFNEMPKTIVAELVSPRKPKVVATSSSPDNMNLNEHFTSTQCLSCGEPAFQDLCDDCLLSTQDTIANLNFRIRRKEERLMNAHRVCLSCTSSAPSDPIHCESLDCQWFYARRKAEVGMELVPLFAELSEELENCVPHKENDCDDEMDSDSYETEDHLLYVSDVFVDDEMEK
ncbi:hypothetical protein BDZ97DRAFT_1647924 [Flammula alnicola]|nr:hypothetical protein BDZ97DRAFT_1647924 [Flammula alnicola]